MAPIESTVAAETEASVFVQVPETILPNGTVVPAFLVGRYLCSIDDAGSVLVSPTMIPKVGINYHEARAACESAGVKLITELQHLALAVNIASVAANWTGGAVGEGQLYQGLHDWTVEEAQSSHSVDANKMVLPTTAAQVRDFIGANYSSAPAGDPTDGDLYTVSAHDLISSFADLAEFMPLPAPQGAQEVELPPITDEDKRFLHYNPNTSDIVEWVQNYARAALSRVPAPLDAAWALRQIAQLDPNSDSIGTAIFMANEALSRVPAEQAKVHELYLHEDRELLLLEGDKPFCRFERFTDADPSRSYWALAKNQSGTELETLLARLAPRKTSDAALVRGAEMLADYLRETGACETQLSRLAALKAAFLDAAFDRAATQASQPAAQTSTSSKSTQVANLLIDNGLGQTQAFMVSEVIGKIYSAKPAAQGVPQKLPSPYRIENGTRLYSEKQLQVILACMQSQCVPDVSIREMAAILDKHLIKSKEYTDCAIIYEVTFDQLHALYAAGIAAAAPNPPAGQEGGE